MSRKHPPILKSLLLPPSLVLEAISVISVSAMNRYRAERRRSESISSFTPIAYRERCGSRKDVRNKHSYDSISEISETRYAATQI